jgi:hypothetical protein
MGSKIIFLLNMKTLSQHICNYNVFIFHMQSKKNFMLALKNGKKGPFLHSTVVMFWVCFHLCAAAIFGRNFVFYE